MSVQIYRYFTSILCVFCKTAAPIRRFSLDQGHSKSSFETSASGPRIFSLKNSSPKRWPSEPKFWWPFFLCFRNQLLPANRYQKQRNPLREPHNFLILKKYICEKNISFILKKTVILNEKDPYLQFAGLFDFFATAKKWALNPQFQRWFALIKPFRK